MQHKSEVETYKKKPVSTNNQKFQKTHESTTNKITIHQRGFERLSSMNTSSITADIEEIQRDPWPTGVHCEINIGEWERQLNRFDLIDKYAFLLEGFNKGFHQGIPQHKLGDLQYYCPQNHTSALKVQEKIQKNLDKELKAHRMFGPYNKDYVFNNLGFFSYEPTRCSGKWR